MARTKPAPAPSDDTLIGVAPPADAPTDALVDDPKPIEVASDGTPAESVATSDGSTEPLPEIPETAYGPDAKPLEVASDLVEAAKSVVLSDEEKAKLDELGATIQPEFSGPPADNVEPPLECPQGHLKGSAKVWEHGSLNYDGTLHGPGTVLLLCPCDISDEDAKRLVEMGVLVDPHKS